MKRNVLLITILFGAFTLFINAQGQKTKEEQLIENVKKICDEIVERSLGFHKLSWELSNDWLLPLYYYLGNAMVPEVQKIAADALAQLTLKCRWAETEKCMKFLSEGYPIHVRSAALGVVLAGKSEKEFNEKRKEYFKKIEPQIKKAFIELACGDVMPPYFDSILMGFLCFTEGHPRNEYYSLVPEEKRDMFVRRMLHVIKASKDHKFIWEMISRFPFEVYSKAMKEWYVTQQDPELRYHCLKYFTLGKGRIKGKEEYIKWKKEFLEMIVSQEWDKRIVELAEKSLSDMEVAGLIE